MSSNRIIALLDVDSFECQIYQQEQPQFFNNPCVVADQTGRIVSISYEAKLLGITRDNRANDVDRDLPYVEIFWKPQVYNKPESAKCRQAGLDITDVILKFCNKRRITVEYIPFDEWFLDLTDHVDYFSDKFGKSVIPDLSGDDNVFSESKSCLQYNGIAEKLDWLNENYENFSQEENLVVGGGIVKKLMDIIYQKTDFVCSAGISGNKLLAKQAAKIHKPQPNILTMLSTFGLHRVSKDIPIRDIWGLGSELGDQVEDSLPYVNTMADLKKVPKWKLISLFDENVAEFLYDRARGICDEEVVSKVMTSTVNCSKANLYVKSNKALRFHLNNLSRNMIERLEEEEERNNRYTNSLKIKFTYYYENDEDDSESSIERTFPYDGEDFSYVAQQCFLEIRQWGFNPNNWNDETVISSLKLTAKNFLDL